MGVIQYIVDLGASVMLPIIIMILGLLLRQGIGEISSGGYNNRYRLRGNWFGH